MCVTIADIIPALVFGAIDALFFAELSGESLVALSTLAIDSGSDTGVSSFALPFAFTDVLASCSSRVSSTMSLITSSVEDSSFLISSDISSPKLHSRFN
ncbi:MAG: hypothetical protein CM15mV16_0170 [uncultured marine virus]|nr:MAG: hypothetical protein CM15mV16_0170 [uncultured marine virus]